MFDVQKNDFDQYMEEADKQQAPLQQEAQPFDQDDPDNECENLINLLDYLDDALVNAPKMPLSNKRMVDANMCVEIINDIRSVLPTTIQYADQMLRERERITRSAEQAAANTIDAAKTRAKAILDDAEERSRQMNDDANRHADQVIREAELHAAALVDENSIMIEAQKKAAEMLNEATLEAQSRRDQVNAYCDQLLRTAESSLGESFEAIRSSRQNLNRNRTEKGLMQQ